MSRSTTNEQPISRTIRFDIRTAQLAEMDVLAVCIAAFPTPNLVLTENALWVNALQCVSLAKEL